MATNPPNGPKPKAHVGRVIPYELKSKIEQVLTFYNKIPLDQFATVYYFEHDELLDATHLGYKHGLFELLSNVNSVVLSRHKSGTFIELCPTFLPAHEDAEESKENERPTDIVSLVKLTHDRRKYKDFFSQDNFYLWPAKHRSILFKKLSDIKLVRSPYEDGLAHNRQLMLEVAQMAHEVLSKHANGVYIDQLYKLLPINYLKNFLNQPSAVMVVFAYPELFYCIAPDDGGRTLVYDGRTQTCDLSGADFNDDDTKLAYRIASSSIVYGVYQMTLMLIKKAGKEGLKIASWEESIYKTFKALPENFSKLKLDPLTFFRALASCGLVQIKSHQDQKNDLRVHIPKSSVEFQALLEQAQNLKI